MVVKKALILVSCLTVLGLLEASCAPAAAPTATAKPPAGPATPAKPAAAPATGTPASKPAAPAPTPKPAADQPRSGGILTVGVGGDPSSLDAHKEEAGYTLAITNGTYNGLAKYDPHGWPEVKVIPDLATNWELSPDGTVYTFHLVKGAKFHDGSPVTAEDAKFSFDRIRDPQLGLSKSPRRQQLGNVANIDTPDGSTVKITLKSPQASFLAFISAPYYPVYPKRVVLDKKGDMSSTVLGSGPFKFKEYAAGVGWELEKNKDYFVQGRPYLDKVKGYVIKDSFTRFAAFRTGNILWWGPVPYMSVSQAKTVAETLSDKMTVQWEFHPAWYGAVFNVNKPPWSDVRVRRAVTLAFDRKRMLAVGLEGAGVVGMSAQPPGEWSLPEDEMAKVPGYAKPDIEGARKLLTEAGFPNGFRTEALVRAQAMQQALATLFKDAVAGIGITADLNVVENAVYEDQRFRKAFAIMASSAGTALVDPDIILGDFYLSNSANNWSGYKNPRYDELYLKQSRTLDTRERRKIVWEMQRMLLEDVTIAVAYWSKVAYAWWKDVRNYSPPSLAHQHAFQYQDVWLAK
ncbi:MAG: ABC transporter substrate-binding protein [Chloroflexi bacterium]|nr:ABC transporter substrate-binding protein [Chloroflexota bacterium]